MFSFLSRPKPALRPQFSLISDKALFLCLLFAVTFSLLVARPARAQYLGEQLPRGRMQTTPCDANGVIFNPQPYPGYDGFFIMNGTEHVTITHGYPADMMDAALAAVPNDGYQADWLGAAYPLFLNALPAPDPTTLYQGLGYWAGISSAHEAEALNNYSNGSYIYSLYDANGSHTGLVNGSLTVDVTGHLVSYFKVVWFPSNSSNPAPMPDHINLLLKTNVSADVLIDPGTSRQSTGLWAQATASDGSPFAETAAAGVGLNDGGTSMGLSGTPLVTGYHVVRAGVDPVTHIATVYLDGTAHYTASNSVPYGILSSPSNPYGQVTNGPTRAYAASGVSAGVQPDSRQVTISSNFDSPTTYHSDPVHHHQIQNVRQPDGSMAADIPVPSILGTPATYSPIISGNWGSNSTYSWQSSLPNSSHQTLSETGIFNSTDLLGNKTIPGVAGIYYNPPVSDRNSDTITLTLKDGVDGATASNTYTVRFHHPHAVPINFRCTSVIAHSDGTLEYHYTWESSTGNMADLVDCKVKERVSYEGNSTGIYIYDNSRNRVVYSPPAPFSAVYLDPEIYADFPGEAGYLDDDHFPGDINAPYVAATYGSTQYYIYTDETMDPTNPNEYAVLAGPIDIVRTVWAPGANWVYEITKYDAPVGASKSYGQAQKVLGPVHP